MSRVPSRAVRSTGGPLAIYTLLSLGFFGRPLLHGDRDYIGIGYDPLVFIWSLGWWPHALLEGDLWRTTPTRPAFFADDFYRACFRPDETLFIPDAAGMEATLWQAESSYRFRLANGSLNPVLPEGIPDPEVAYSILYDTVPEGGGAAVVRLARGLEATVILLDAPHVAQWSPVLVDAGLRPVEQGGVWLYHLRPARSSCR